MPKNTVPKNTNGQLQPWDNDALSKHKDFDPKTMNFSLGPPKNEPNLNYDAEKHAEFLWKNDIVPKLKNGENVGLVYSANNNQAKAIHSANNSGQPLAPHEISGSGQAPLFHALAKIIKREKQYEGRVQILPVATSMIGGNDQKPQPNGASNQVTQAQINRDMAAIAALKQQGWSITGPGNQGKFSIGGGNSKGWANDQLPNGTTRAAVVQSTLQTIAGNTPSVTKATTQQSQPQSQQPLTPMPDKSEFFTKEAKEMAIQQGASNDAHPTKPAKPMSSLEQALKDEGITMIDAKDAPKIKERLQQFMQTKPSTTTKIEENISESQNDNNHEAAPK